MIKNPWINWHIPSTLRGEPLSLEEIHKAFLNEQAQKVLLRQNFLLYKFSQFDSLAPPDQEIITPWWSPYNAYEHDSGLTARIQVALNNRTTLRELSRNLVAVREDWSTLRFLQIISIKNPYYAFWGGVAPQVRLTPNAQSKRLSSENRGSPNTLIGLATQFYIPKLMITDVNLEKCIDLDPLPSSASISPPSPFLLSHSSARPSSQPPPPPSFLSLPTPPSSSVIDNQRFLESLLQQLQGL